MNCVYVYTGVGGGARDSSGPSARHNIYHQANFETAGTEPGKGQAPWQVLAQPSWAARWGLTTHLSVSFHAFHAFSLH